MLSPDVSKHTMLLFTYGDRLENTDINMEMLTREDDNIQHLLQSCSGVYHVFNNKMKNKDQVQELLQKINNICEGGQLYYRRRNCSVRFNRRSDGRSNCSEKEKDQIGRTLEP
ncbi:hypothetical protein ACER0C_003642 [Sarotherodon galilaeus]